MELPQELVSQILLPLDYEEIMQYCLTNRVAREICQSEWFWNQKALYDFGVPITVFPTSPVELYLKGKE